MSEIDCFIVCFKLRFLQNIFSRDEVLTIDGFWMHGRIY
jgi:hypothetical protein